MVRNQSVPSRLKNLDTFIGLIEFTINGFPIKLEKLNIKNKNHGKKGK